MNPQKSAFTILELLIIGAVATCIILIVFQTARPGETHTVTTHVKKTFIRNGERLVVTESEVFTAWNANKEKADFLFGSIEDGKTYRLTIRKDLGGTIITSAEPTEEQ